MIPEPSDAEWVARARDGSLEAFEALVSRHEQRVYSTAFRIVRNQPDAEDVTQQTFLSVIEHLAGFRGDSSFSTWVQRIATHAALKVLRKRRGLETIPLEPSSAGDAGFGAIPHPLYIADWRESPADLLKRKETAALLDQALAGLDDKHRLVFLLRDVQGFSVKETALELGISEANTKVRLLRARLQLRERLTQEFGNPETRIERGHHPH